MITHILLFAAGLVLLIKGADLVVEHAKRTAKMLGVSNFMIGVTLVAFSTTLPEFSVSVLSSIMGSPEIAAGTTMGSIIANPALILGLAAALVPLSTNRGIIKLNYILLLYLLVLSFLLVDGLVWYEGAALLVLFAGYIAELVKNGNRSFSSRIIRKRKARRKTVAKHALFTLLGGGLVVLGARMLIDATISISQAVGIPEIVIALIAVAVGTSLPEMTVAITAAFRKVAGISIGDILGANMFNIMVLASASLFSPIPATEKLLSVVVPIALVVNALLLVFMSTDLWFISKKWQLSRYEGMILLFIYALFVYLQLA